MMQQLAQGPGRCSRPVACPPRSLGRPARALAARARRSTLVVVVRASGSNAGEGAAGGEGELEEASSSSSPPTRSVATKRAYTSLQSKPPIGAEYGEASKQMGVEGDVVVRRQLQFAICPNCHARTHPCIVRAPAAGAPGAGVSSIQLRELHLHDACQDGAASSLLPFTASTAPPLRRADAPSWQPSRSRERGHPWLGGMAGARSCIHAHLCASSCYTCHTHTLLTATTAAHTTARCRRCSPLQGFVHFGYGTEPRRLDVDTLNERLKHSGAVRLRHTLKPDEAYGSIFNFDTVVADTEGAYRRAWVELATHRGLPLPSHVRLQMQQTCPERIIMDVSTQAHACMHAPFMHQRRAYSARESFKVHYALEVHDGRVRQVCPKSLPSMRLVHRRRVACWCCA